MADVRDSAARSRALPSAGHPLPGLAGHRLGGGCLQGRRGRLEEKQDRDSAPLPLPVRAAAARVGGTGGFGAHRHKMLLFSCRPVHVAGAGAARQPAPRGYSWIRPMAPGTARQERLQGGEDMNQSGVPSPAGGSWPVRQLPITQPGSVYSRSTTPHRLPCQAGEGNVLLGWGWHSRRALFGDGPPPRPPGAAVARGLL